MSRVRATWGDLWQFFFPMREFWDPRPRRRGRGPFDERL
jgi:hypothetical protein